MGEKLFYRDVLNMFAVTAMAYTAFYKKSCTRLAPDPEKFFALSSYLVFS